MSDETEQITEPPIKFEVVDKGQPSPLKAVNDKANAEIFGLAITVSTILLFIAISHKIFWLSTLAVSALAISICGSFIYRLKFIYSAKGWKT